MTYPLEVIILRMTRCQYSCAVAIRMPQVEATDVAMPSKRGLQNTRLISWRLPHLHDRIRPVKLVRQGSEHERGDGADDDKDGTGEDLILDPLAVVEVLTGPGILYKW